jgi:hypothetical protein
MPDDSQLLWWVRFSLDPFLKEPCSIPANIFSFLQVFGMPDDSQLLWWVRFSLDPYGRLLAAGNRRGIAYVWEPGMGRPHKPAVLKHNKCTSVVSMSAVDAFSKIVVFAEACV